MKKNYSNPKFKLVLLDSNDIVCTSDLRRNNDVANGNDPNGGADAKRRPDIWDE